MKLRELEEKDIDRILSWMHFEESKEENSNSNSKLNKLKKIMHLITATQRLNFNYLLTY